MKIEIEILDELMKKLLPRFEQAMRTLVMGLKGDERAYYEKVADDAAGGKVNPKEFVIWLLICGVRAGSLYDGAVESVEMWSDTTKEWEWVE